MRLPDIQIRKKGEIMTDEQKNQIKERRAKIYDFIVVLMAIAIFVQVTMPSLLQLVRAWSAK